MLEHEDGVADADAERAAGAAFADDGRDDRRPEGRHLEEVPRDGLGDAALLALEARVRARRVDEREDGFPELLRELHDAERLAVTLGAGHAEVAPDLFLRVAALLVAHDRDGPTPEHPEARDDGRVVRERAVALPLDEVVDEDADVVERERAVRMPRDERLLPGGEVLVDLPRELPELLAELLDLTVLRGAVREALQLLQPVPDALQGRFELGLVRHGETVADASSTPLDSAASRIQTRNGDFWE